MSRWAMRRGRAVVMLALGPPNSPLLSWAWAGYCCYIQYTMSCWGELWPVQTCASGKIRCLASVRFFPEAIQTVASDTDVAQHRNPQGGTEAECIGHGARCHGN